MTHKTVFETNSTVGEHNMYLTSLVKRYEGNPLLTQRNLSGADAVFNAGAVKFNDTYILLVSVSIPGKAGNGRAIHIAESKNGINFAIRETPFIAPGQGGSFTEFDYDICDPRVTPLEGTYYVTYPAHLPGVGVVGIMGRTDDFVNFERISIAAMPWNRVPVLFPEKINGMFWRLDRPMSEDNGTLWTSQSLDLEFWGRHKLLARAGRQVWNSMKLGPSGVPIKTSKGWLVIYHAVAGGGMSSPIYHQAAMLLKLEDPSVILAKPDEYILAPTEDYERHGRVPNVVFSCGHVVEPDGTVKLYYAGADTCICLATFNAEEMAKACLKEAEE